MYQHKNNDIHKSHKRCLRYFSPVLGGSEESIHLKRYRYELRMVPFHENYFPFSFFSKRFGAISNSENFFYCICWCDNLFDGILITFQSLHLFQRVHWQVRQFPARPVHFLFENLLIVFSAGPNIFFICLLFFNVKALKQLHSQYVFNGLF